MNEQHRKSSAEGRLGGGRRLRYYSWRLSRAAEKFAEAFAAFGESLNHEVVPALQRFADKITPIVQRMEEEDPMQQQQPVVAATIRIEG
jgi:hypothetical protein